jgi:hypothetical protein
VPEWVLLHAPRERFSETMTDEELRPFQLSLLRGRD